VSKIKIGQIGVGHAHAAGKMAAYRESAEYEVVGLVEPDDSLRKAASGRDPYKDLPWISQQQLLSIPGLQAVAVETRVDDLLPTAQACVEAGMHIHLDKPAGESLPQFKRVLDTAAAKHLLVQMGHMYRYNPGVLLMRDLLKRGDLGDPFEVHTVMSKVVSKAARLNLAKFRGGMMFELGCHITDLVIGVLGEPKSVAPFNQHAAAFDDTLVDNMLTVLTYDRASATIKSSAMEVDGFARRHFVLCGSGGTIHIEPLDSPKVRLALSSPSGKYRRGYQQIELPQFRRYIADAADMARIIRGEKDSDFSYEHDLIVQRTILQACGLPIDR